MKFKTLDSAMGVARILVKPTTPPEPVKITPPPQHSKRELVAGGDVRWKPIDKAASMILAKSPEINKHHEHTQIPRPATDVAQNIQSTQGAPPSVAGYSYMQSKKKGPVQTQRRRLEHHGKLGVQTKHNLAMPKKDIDSGHLIRVDDVDRLIIKTATEKTRRLEEIETQAREARAQIETALFGLGEMIDDVETKTKQGLAAVRTIRMSVVQDVHQTVQALKEVRAFFHGPDHEKEIARLREFVEVCERLKALKDDGFLDAITDTMLKLS